MANLKQRIERIEAKIKPPGDMPEMTVAGIVYWMETRKQLNGGILSPADEAKGNEAFRQLWAKARR